MRRTDEKDSKLTHKKAIRFSNDEQKIIDKVRSAFKQSSDGEAVRFIVNFWWTSLGSDAVDVKKLGNMLAKEKKRAEGDKDESA